MSTTLPLDLDDVTLRRLHVLSEARGQEAADLVRSALVEFLDRYEGLAEDAARWKGYAETGGALDHDTMSGPLDRIGARARSVAAAISGPLGGRRGAAADDLPHPDDDTARDAARRAFRALSEEGR